MSGTTNSDNEDEKLEREAVALWKQYGFFLPSPVKAFLRRLAAFLSWQTLQEAMR